MKTLINLGIALVLLAGLAACAPATQLAEHSHPPAASVEVPRITVDEVLQKIDQGQDVVFLDSRNDVDWGYAQTKIPGAIRVGNNDQLRTLVDELPKESFIVAYCT